MNGVCELVPTVGATYTPMTLMDRFIEDYGWRVMFMDCGDTAWTPDMDVRETNADYVVTAELPGIDMSKLDITYEDGTLTLKGEKTGENAQGETCYCEERYFGTFERSLDIPGKVNQEKMTASYKDGVLKVTLPKAEESKAKKITVQ